MLRRDAEIFKIRLKLFEANCLKQETNVMQARLANQHQVILPS